MGSIGLAKRLDVSVLPQKFPFLNAHWDAK